MNRSLLLVICDFLLLSLLALARFDDPEEDVPQREMTAEERAAADAAVDRDLVEILKMSLDAEKTGTQELSQTLEQTQAELEEREKTLAEKEARLSEVQLTAEELAAQKAALEKARADAEAERTRLATEAEKAQKELRQADAERVELATTLAEAKETSAASTERLKAMQEEMQRQQKLLDTIRSESERLASEKRIAESRAQELESRLKVAETESRVIATTLQTARADIEANRQEKQAILQTTDKLAEGVGALAQSTDAVAKEVKQMQPQSLNALFDRYRRNRVRLTFEAEESGFLGSSQKTYTADTLLVTNGERTYALVHIDETPFANSGLQAVKGQMEMGGRVFRVPQVGFLASDPRVVTVAVPDEMAAQYGVEPFTVAADPLRFPEAVLIDSTDNAYAESPFKLDPSDPRYVLFKNDLFTKVFGEFSPGRGDLVLAKTGDFLGLMMTSRVALAAPALSSRAYLSLGDKFSSAKANEMRQMVETATARLKGDLR